MAVARLGAHLTAAPPAPQDTSAPPPAPRRRGLRADAAAGAAGGAPPAPPPEQPSDTTPRTPQRKATPTGADGRAVALALVLFVVALGVAAWTAPERDADPAIREVEGLTAFALFYAFAFAIERVLEPIVSWDRLTPAARVERDQFLNEARRESDRARQHDLLDEAALKQDELDRWRANRTVVVLGVATVLGALLAGPTRLYFLDAVGVAEGTLPHWLNAFATALVVGGGTKPLHDVITRIEKSKEAAKDPSETGGNA